MSFRQSLRMLPDIDFSANGQPSVDIPRDRLIKAIVLRIKGQVDTSSTPASAVEDNPVSLIKSIQVIGDGSQVLYSLSGIDAYYLTQFKYGVVPTITAVPDAVAGARELSALIVIPFEAIGGRVPADSYLDSTVFKSLQLKLTFGTLADLHDATISETSGEDITVEVMVEETTVPEPNFLSKWYTLQRTISASNANFDIDFPLGNFFKTIMIRAMEGTAPGARSNSPFTSVSLISSGSVNHVQALPILIMKERLALNQALADTTGIYYYEFPEDGLLASMLNGSDTNDLKLRVASVAGTNTILHVTLNELIPPQA